MSEFKKEYLGAGITCFVSDDHTFGTDAVLLAHFAAPKSKTVCCDLGSGCGIIPLLWCKGETGHITAVEIQEQAARQIDEAIEFNSLEDRLTAVCADLRNLKGAVPFGHFDLVTMNPPYKASGAGIISKSDADKIARHDTMCTLNDMCECAAHLLNFGGRFCACIRPERLSELFVTMSKNGIEPKRLRLVSKYPGKAPWLALVEGKRGAKSSLKVENELYVYGPGGEYSDEMKMIYGDYLLENRGD